MSKLLYPRAIAYFPQSAPKGDGDFTLNKQQSLISQLLRIESQHLTGCIKMQSERLQSRAAVLIIHGRVFGCVYGSRRIQNQIFGAEALSYMLADVPARDTIIESFAMAPELALAAAAMFHGGKFKASHSGEPVKALQLCLDLLAKTEGPGSIVVLDDDQKPAMVLYADLGDLIGVNCLGREKTALGAVKDKKSLMQYLTANPQSNLLVNSLAFTHYDRKDMTFSLTRLSKPSMPVFDRCAQAQKIEPEEKNLEEIDRLIAAQMIQPTEKPKPSTLGLFLSSRRNIATKLNLGIAHSHPYRIDPACKLA